jgi:hypothetical protein
MAAQLRQLLASRLNTSESKRKHHSTVSLFGCGHDCCEASGQPASDHNAADGWSHADTSLHILFENPKPAI